MLNLLPEYQKRKVIAEYRFRLLIMIIALICILALIFCIFTLPAYMYARTKNAELRLQKDGLNAIIGAGNVPGAGQDNESFSKAVDALKPFADSLRPNLILDVVAPSAGSGIKINTYTIVPVSETLSSVAIAGNADSREALTNYTGFLNGRFGGVKLPLSALAKPNDIPFGFRFQVDTTKALRYSSSTPLSL